MTQSKLVSVIIPCYNHGHFLTQAIGSALGQTHRPVEVIVVDDGSTDSTAAVAAMYGTAIRYVFQSNRGLSAARNRGLDEMTGEYVQFLDADDVIMPKKFEKQLARRVDLHKPFVGLCEYVRGRADDVYSIPSPPAPYLPPRIGAGPLWYEVARDWETRMSVPPHCFLLSASFFRKGIRFDDTLENHEDWDCWMQVLAQSAEVQYCPEVLALYRFVPNSMSHNSRKMRAGFLRAIDKQLALNRKNPEMHAILLAKRAETAACYDSWLASKGGITGPYWYFRCFLRRLCRWLGRRLFDQSTPGP